MDKKKALSSVHHLFTGMLLIMKGYEKMGHHYPLLGSLIIFSGLLIIGYFIYQRNNPNHYILKILVHSAEAISLGIVSYIYFDEGRKYLQYAVLLAALVYLGTVVYMLIKKKEIGAQSH